MRTQYFDLNLVPGKVGPVVHLSQYDEDADALVFKIYNGSTTLDLTGMDVSIKGTKPDRHGFSYAGTVSGSRATFDVTQQMTAVAGQFAVEVRVVDGSDDVGTVNMIFDIEPAALADDTDISETEIPDIVDAARSYMERAEAAADAAEVSEGNAEAWAVGQRDGTDVPSTDSTYENNAKFYAGEAGDSATNAGTSEYNAGVSETNAAASERNAAASEAAALLSKTHAGASETAAAQSALYSQSYAVGGSDLPTRPNEDIDNSKYYMERAELAARDAEAQSGLVDFVPATSSLPGTHGLVPAPPIKTGVPQTLMEDGWAANDADLIAYDNGRLSAYMPMYQDFVVGTDGTLTTASGTVEDFAYSAYLTVTWTDMTAYDALEAVMISGTYSGNFGVLPGTDTLIVYFEDAPTTGDTIRVYKIRGVEDPGTTTPGSGVKMTANLVAGSIATIETGQTASRGYSVGELVWYNGTLYQVKLQIVANDPFSVGTNIEEKTVSEVICNLSSAISALGLSVVNGAINITYEEVSA